MLKLKPGLLNCSAVLFDTEPYPPAVIVVAPLFAPIPTIPPPAVTDVFTPEAPADPPETGPLFPVTVPMALN